MDYIAACKNCHQVFTFRVIEAPAKIERVLCLMCGHEAVVGYGELLRAYHAAFPNALGKKQRRKVLSEVLKVARRVIKTQGQLTPEQVTEVLEDVKASQETKRIFDIVANWLFAAIGPAGGIASVVCAILMLQDILFQHQQERLADRLEAQRRHAEMMLAVNQLVEISRQNAESNAAECEVPRASRRSRSGSPKRAPEQTASQPREKKKTEQSKKRNDVPLG